MRTETGMAPLGRREPPRRAETGLVGQLFPRDLVAFAGFRQAEIPGNKADLLPHRDGLELVVHRAEETERRIPERHLHEAAQLSRFGVELRGQLRATRQPRNGGQRGGVAIHVNADRGTHILHFTSAADRLLHRVPHVELPKQAIGAHLLFFPTAVVGHEVVEQANECDRILRDQPAGPERVVKPLREPV